jgi:hypothetical protein
MKLQRIRLCARHDSKQGRPHIRPQCGNAGDVTRNGKVSWKSRDPRECLVSPHSIEVKSVRTRVCLHLKHVRIRRSTRECSTFQEPPEQASVGVRYRGAVVFDGYKRCAGAVVDVYRSITNPFNTLPGAAGNAAAETCSGYECGLAWPGEQKQPLAKSFTCNPCTNPPCS